MASAASRALDLAGQPIEQFGMRGTPAHVAEVAGSIDDARAEMVVPEAIGQNAGRQRIVGMRDPLGQLQPPLPLGRIVASRYGGATASRADRLAGTTRRPGVADRRPGRRGTCP